MIPSGYSGKSLSQKLGLKEGMNAKSFSAPDDYKLWMGPSFDLLQPASKPPWDFIHLFVNSTDELENNLHQFRSQLMPDGMIWVSWYKKSSKKPTQITEDVIRDTCLPLGFVDVKVCAISQDWSALKLVIRKEMRK